LEADARLFPEGPHGPQDQLVDVELPAMRKRIESSTGVQIPGVRIRSDENQLGEGGYALVLNDVSRVFATVYVAERYCPDAAACESIGILGRPSVNPWDGKRGMWLSDSAAAQASSAQLTLLDAYQYMVAHLEWFVRRNLGALVGVQEVHEMLERWAKDQKERRDLIERTLPDSELRVRFTHVLQGLIREGVPIGDLTTMLTAFAAASASLSSVSEIVERVRPALRAVLPGNEGNRQQIALSDEFESIVGLCVWEREGKRFLAIAPDVAQNLLSELRARLGGVEQEDAALVVRQPGLRPFIRRLIDSEFPWLPVLAEHELTPRLAPLAEQVEYRCPYAANSPQAV
jgi:flagellar biosynthesis protein FlhA